MNQNNEPTSSTEPAVDDPMQGVMLATNANNLSAIGRRLVNMRKRTYSFHDMIEGRS